MADEQAPEKDLLGWSLVLSPGVDAVDAREPVLRMAIQTRATAQMALARSIGGVKNPFRRHSVLGFVGPASLERQAACQTAPY